MADPVVGPTLDGDVYRATIIQRLYDQRVLNMLWYEVTDAGGGAVDRWTVMIALANELNSVGGVVPLMQDITSQDLAFERVRVNTYRVLADRFPYAEIVLALTGGVPTPAGTANVALSIEKRGFSPGAHPRRGIGRLQVGGIPNDAYLEGNFTDDYLATVQPLADELTEDIIAAGVTLSPVLVTFGPDGILKHPIFGTSVKRTVRDMRRRTVGVGE